MSYYELIECYVQCCTSGTASFGECNPLWQIGLVGTFLIASTILLLVVHFQPVSRAGR